MSTCSRNSITAVRRVSTSFKDACILYEVGFIVSYCNAINKSALQNNLFIQVVELVRVHECMGVNNLTAGAGKRDAGIKCC